MRTIFYSCIANLKLASLSYAYETHSESSIEMVCVRARERITTAPPHILLLTPHMRYAYAAHVSRTRCILPVVCVFWVCVQCTCLRGIFIPKKKKLFLSHFHVKFCCFDAVSLLVLVVSDFDAVVSLVWPTIHLAIKHSTVYMLYSWCTKFIHRYRHLHKQTHANCMKICRWLRCELFYFNIMA